MLLYSLLFLSGYNLSLADIKAYRQLGSKTPGYPERGVTEFAFSDDVPTCFQACNWQVLQGLDRSLRSVTGKFCGQLRELLHQIRRCI